MKILFISRKKADDVGGLSRFAQKLISSFPRARYPVDLIHLCDATTLPLGVFLKFIYRKPLTLTVHGLDIVFPNPIYQSLLKLLLPFADTVILDSLQAKKLLLPFKIKKPIHIIHPGISTDQFKTVTPLPLPNLKGKLVLLTVGNLVKRKDHAWFIKNVFSKLSHRFIYLIIGSGPQQETIKKTVQKYKFQKRVFLLDQITDSELGYVFKKTDIYICPNQHIEGDFEGFGLAAGEAAAMGIPVVASNIDGIPAIIKNRENGLLVNPYPQSFIKAINQLKNGHQRKLLGKKAKSYTLRNYKWDQVAKKYSQIFRQMTGKI